MEWYKATRLMQRMPFIKTYGISVSELKRFLTVEVDVHLMLSRIIMEGWFACPGCVAVGEVELPKGDIIIHLYLESSTAYPAPPDQSSRSKWARSQRLTFLEHLFIRFGSDGLNDG
jgi:hypothetical protein